MVPVLALGVSALVPASNAAATTTTNTNCSASDIAKGIPGCKGVGAGAGAVGSTGGNTELFGTNGVVTKAINIALFVVGLLSVIMLIIGGIRYTLSAGNEKAVGAAKSTILYAIIGVVVSLLAYAIVNFVINSFTATS